MVKLLGTKPIQASLDSIFPTAVGVFGPLQFSIPKTASVLLEEYGKQCLQQRLVKIRRQGSGFEWIKAPECMRRVAFSCLRFAQGCRLFELTAPLRVPSRWRDDGACTFSSRSLVACTVPARWQDHRRTHRSQPLAGSTMWWQFSQPLAAVLWLQRQPLQLAVGGNFPSSRWQFSSLAWPALAENSHTYGA